MVKQEAINFSTIQGTIPTIEDEISGDVIKDVENKLIPDDWAKSLKVVSTKEGVIMAGPT